MPLKMTKIAKQNSELPKVPCMNENCVETESQNICMKVSEIDTTMNDGSEFDEN